jgi:hypothetical protein
MEMIWLALKQVRLYVWVTGRNRRTSFLFMWPRFLVYKALVYFRVHTFYLSLGAGVTVALCFWELEVVWFWISDRASANLNAKAF